MGWRSQPRSAVLLTRLSTREPVAGAKVEVLDQKKDAAPRLLGTTDANGMLELPGDGDGYVASGNVGDLYIFSEAEKNDRAYLPAKRNVGTYGSRWSRYRWRHEDHFETKKVRPGERLILRIVTERDAYLPGEKVRVVGWAAIDTPYTRSGLTRPPIATPVAWQLKDSHDRVVATVHGASTREGKFWAELPIPTANALGSYRVSAEVLGGTATTYVKVEDFRVPEFSVTASVSA
mgnify:CR=1 FL=1